MDNTEAVLEQIITTISLGILSKTGVARVDYYAAAVVSEATKDLKNVRLRRIFQDETWKTEIATLVDKLNLLLENIRFLPNGAAETAKLQKLINELRLAAGDPGVKMDAG